MLLGLERSYHQLIFILSSLYLAACVFLSTNKYSVRLTTFLIFLSILFSCRKDSFTTSPDAQLRTATDTLYFDTVFTTTGSVTQSFKIFNENSKDISISAIQLKGGVSSPFKINVNGMQGPVVSNLGIEGGDSAYVFVSVSINPSTALLPFVIRDSMEIAYNGNKKMVQLVAYGQNAHFLKNKIITTNEVWNNDLPYVILGGLEVASNAKLTVNKGTKIYVHADAPIIINGSLQVLGEKYDSTRVVISGDRLDEPYRAYPASWPGIYFNNSSRDNILNYSIIKNAYQAVAVLGPSQNTNPKLQVSELVIDNAYDAGLLAVNSSIKAQNLLVSNSGKNVVLVSGGDYQFIHCTLASFGNNLIQHKEPVLVLSDYLDQNPPSNLKAIFRNCIIWGDGGTVDNEVAVSKKGTGLFSVQFDHVLWKVKDAPSNVIATSVINGLEPIFDSVSTSANFYDFRLKENSPAINKGINTSVTLDLDGKQRPVGLPDLGSYEKQ